MTSAWNRTLLREALPLLATYSWHERVHLESTAVGLAEEPSVDDFLREFQARHSLAVGGNALRRIIEAVEERPSRTSGLERSESRGVIRGRLDTPRYLARRAAVRSLPRRYPIVRASVDYTTPENHLVVLALREAQEALRNSPFHARSAEGIAAASAHRFVSDRLRHRPWNEVPGNGLGARLAQDVTARVRRRQTGNDDAYARLIDWYAEWSLDPTALGSSAMDDLIEGLLAFPIEDAFWDKVFEVWCLRLVADVLSGIGWEMVLGPVALHLREGVVYRFKTPSGHLASLRFQKKEPLGTGRWTYREGPALTGVPDLSLAADDSGAFPLLIDAKNRYVTTSGGFTRSEETYKMLGYAENFRSAVSQRFRGILIFPGDLSRHRVLDGPADGRLDLVSLPVTTPDERALALGAIAEAASDWASAL